MARRLRPLIREVWMNVKDPDKLKRRRKQKGFSQIDVAGFARCTQQYISLLESGKDSDCSENIALRICKFLDIDLEDYFEERELVRTPVVTTPSRDARKIPA